MLKRAFCCFSHLILLDEVLAPGEKESGHTRNTRTSQASVWIKNREVYVWIFQLLPRARCMICVVRPIFVLCDYTPANGRSLVKFRFRVSWMQRRILLWTGACGTRGWLAGRVATPDYMQRGWHRNRSQASQVGRCGFDLSAQST